MVIVGGHVNRGEALPELDGQYVFGAFTAEELEEGPHGKLFTAQPASGSGMWTVEELEVAGMTGEMHDHFVLGFGQDLQGEVYVLTIDNAGPMGTTGKLYRLARPEQ